MGIWHRTGSTRATAIPIVLGVGIFLLGLVVPAAVRPLFRFLSLVGLPVGWLVSEAFLRLVFYGVLTPLGLLFRMVGRDPLRLKRRPEPTYWRERKQSRDPSSYLRQA